MLLHLLVAGLVWARNHFCRPPVCPRPPSGTTAGVLHIHANSARRDTVCAPPDAHALHPPCVWLRLTRTRRASKFTSAAPATSLVVGAGIPSRAVLLRGPPDSVALPPCPPFPRHQLPPCPSFFRLRFLALPCLRPKDTCGGYRYLPPLRSFALRPVTRLCSAQSSPMCFPTRPPNPGEVKVMGKLLVRYPLTF